MAQTTAPAVTRQDGAPALVFGPPPRRPLLSRFSAAHGLMVVSGLLAFVLVAVLLGRRDDTVRVAVARADIAPGAAVSAGQVRWAELASDSPMAARLVSPKELAPGTWVATRAITAGAPLRSDDLSRSSDNDGLRWVSIPIPREHAAGGALEPGDLVDVIDVVDAQAAYVVTGVEVAQVARSASTGGITGGTSRDFFVVVRVDAAEALGIAAALADGKLEVVRSTAATPVPEPSTPQPSAG